MGLVNTGVDHLGRGYSSAGAMVQARFMLLSQHLRFDICGLSHPHLQRTCQATTKPHTDSSLLHYTAPQVLNDRTSAYPLFDRRLFRQEVLRRSLRQAVLRRLRELLKLYEDAQDHVFILSPPSFTAWS